MLRILWAVVLLTTLYLSTPSVAQNSSPSEDVTTKNFAFQSWVSAFVIGQYLNEVTFSIDLSKSWRPGDVESRRIRKTGVPTTHRQAYFLDALSNNTVYTWGGFNNGEPQPSNRPLGKFVADGTGGGSWSTEVDSGSLNELTRSHGGAVASTGDSAFYFGGLWEDTDDPTQSSLVPDYFQVKFKSPEMAYTNHTNSANGPFASSEPSRTLYAANAHYIPDFGNGLIIIFGGNSYSPGAGKVENRGMEPLWLLDPVTNRWYSQETGGDKPRQYRRWPCTVGARGRNGTYEIFMFGGNDDGDRFDDVAILSLPGFVWKNVNMPATEGIARTFMSCVRAGKRQMIVVGGITRDKTEDAFSQGLGVFDMTELQWKDSYDATAAEYDSPQVIKSLYDEGNVADIKDDGLREILNISRKTEPSESKETPSPVGAIAGGVVGGVSLVALVVAVIWFLRQRRKRRAQVVSPTDVYQTDTKRPHMGQPTVSYVSEMPTASNVSELAEASNYSELPAELSNPGVHGVNTRSHPAELDATTPHRTAL
ncbi:kelch repeat protein [Colletotrichum plurivorum]|uniref:Kelch repeat protein n=1 Tax=Colletotrichum plurivorum TaxID=2175906 RepID=A0A8H6KDJ9_9PEZI|nr:kelch repeat protein [Colletotrichum plurivorum]